MFCVDNTESAVGTWVWQARRTANTRATVRRERDDETGLVDCGNPCAARTTATSNIEGHTLETLKRLSVVCRVSRYGNREAAAATVRPPPGGP